jgi:hypothetical protein
MAKASEKAPIYAVKRNGRLEPSAQIDEEAFDAIANGSEVELTIKQKRSTERLRLYWSVVGAVVKGGFGPWQTKEALSDALKLACNVTEVRRTLSGDYYVAPDSVAFDRMGEADFGGFMNRAFAQLAERIGCDPVSLLPQREDRSAA